MDNRSREDKEEKEDAASRLTEAPAPFLNFSFSKRDYIMQLAATEEPTMAVSTVMMN